MKYLKKFATRAEYEAYMADNMENYPHVGYIADEGAVEYVKEAPPMPDKMPLHFEALEDLTVSFSLNAIEYSLDNQSWVGLPADTATPTISAGSKVYFRASGLTPGPDVGIGTFSTTGKFNAIGNVMSMVDGADFADIKSVAEEGLSAFFKNCTGLINADKLILPAITLAPYCYCFMFNGCTSLVTAPALPATTMQMGCYYMMFDNCSSLVTAPALPAEELAKSCYIYMFRGCTSLTNVPAILPALTLKESCYSYMFKNCTSLVTAPILPATKLNGSNCYSEMFNGCSKLSYVKALFLTTPASSYTSQWLYNVASTGTFVKNAAATWDVTGSNGIPSGWTVETATE